MTGVSFALADFVSGGPILDLPVLPGATWASMLNRADSLDATVNLNDPDALRLDLRSSSEPKKTVLLARTDDDVILAGGLITDREWDEDKRTLNLNATGFRSSYFGSTIIGPASALTTDLVNADGTPNTALDAYFSGWSLGTIGKKIIAQRLTWPGAPLAPFVLPADQIGAHERTDWPFLDYKTIESALDDLTDVENGPDFAIDFQRAADGLSLSYVLRHGSEAEPRIGARVGAWSLGSPASPISGLKISDDGTEIASASWALAGKSNDVVLASRKLNTAMVTANGYPPLDYVDKSHSSVSLQATLDDHASENLAYAAGKIRETSFTVRGDASPALGAYRCGDVVTIDVVAGHPFIAESFDVRITSISGNETGAAVKIGCVILDA